MAKSVKRSREPVNSVPIYPHPTGAHVKKGAIKNHELGDLN